MHPTSFRVGDATITKIPELALDGADPAVLLPGSDPSAIRHAARALGPGSYDAATGRLRQSVHAWLVRMPDRVLLIDTGTGNDKPRPAQPIFDRLHQPFLERLEAAGARPEEVDAVLLTHLHADHVGWNTALSGSTWRPVFTRAVHILSARERDYNAALAADPARADAIRAEAGLEPPIRAPLPGVFADSVVPVLEAGLARAIAIDGSEAFDGVRFLPTPGHSIDHASIMLESRGERALFWGDVLHHPLQAALPDANSVYCEFPETAIRSRRHALSLAAETGALVFTTHFAESSAGTVTEDRDGFRWRFA